MDNTISHHLKHRFKAHIGGKMGNKPKIDTNIPSMHKSLVLSHFWANMGKIRGKEAERDSLLRMVLIKLLRFIRNKPLRSICYILLYIHCYILGYIFDSTKLFLWREKKYL